MAVASPSRRTHAKQSFPHTPQACYFVHEPTRKSMLMRWSTAFAHALLGHVRADVEPEEQLQGVLAQEEVEAVCAVGQSSAPSFVVQVGAPGVCGLGFAP
jgi:hypothetical protein